MSDTAFARPSIQFPTITLAGVKDRLVEALRDAFSTGFITIPVVPEQEMGTGAVVWLRHHKVSVPDADAINGFLRERESNKTYLTEAVLLIENIFPQSTMTVCLVEASDDEENDSPHLQVAVRTRINPKRANELLVSLFKQLIGKGLVNEKNAVNIDVDYV